MSGSGWFGGWFDGVKDKVNWQTLEGVRNDLNEFRSVMQTGTRSVIGTTTQTVSGTLNLGEESAVAGDVVRKSWSALVSGVSHLLTVPPDDSADLVFRIDDRGEPVYDRLQAQMAVMKKNPATYLTEPVPEGEEQRQWLAEFSLENFKTALSDLLIQDAGVRQMYTQLVPAETTSNNFWRNYFFNAWVAEQRELKRRELQERADRLNVAPATAGGAELGWGDDDSEEWSSVVSGANASDTSTKKGGAEHSSPSQCHEACESEHTIQRSEPAVTAQPGGLELISPAVPTEALTAAEQVDVLTNVVNLSVACVTSQSDDHLPTASPFAPTVAAATPPNAAPECPPAALTDSTESARAESNDIESIDDVDVDAECELTAEELELARQAAQTLHIDSGAHQTKPAEGTPGEEDDWERWE